MKFLRVAMAVSALSVTISAEAQYNIQALGSLSGQGSLAYGLNSNGMVVGQSFNAVTGVNEAVVWNNGAIQSLGFQGLARDVNNSGTVVGETASASLFGPNGRAFSWSSGIYNDLGDLGGSHAGAYAINDAGTIAGFSFTEPNDDGGPEVYYSHAFKIQDGTMSDLGTVSDPLGYSRGHGLNDANEVAGRASLVKFQGGQKHTAFWDDTGDITSIIGPGIYSTAQDINNNGLMVGNGYNASSRMMGAVTKDGVTELIGTFGGTESRLFSVNDDDVMVGFARNGDASQSALVSFDGENIIDLETLVTNMYGWDSLEIAYAINNSGDIVGQGTTSSGEQMAFLLTSASAVPVPAAAYLFGSALLGLIGVARKR